MTGTKKKSNFGKNGSPPLMFAKLQEYSGTCSDLRSISACPIRLGVHDQEPGGMVGV